VRDMPQQFPKFVWQILTANAMNITRHLVRVRADDLQLLRSGNVCGVHCIHCNGIISFSFVFNTVGSLFGSPLARLPTSQR
jgi:hypothetical protein